MIIGTGIDIIEIQRVAKAMERHGQRFVDRLLSAEEQQPLGPSPIATERIAGRFAAKEAVLKALGCGLSNLSWHEIVIVADAHGAPQCRLLDRAAEWAAGRQIERVHITISHSRDYAVAQAIAEGRAV